NPREIFLGTKLAAIHDSLVWDIRLDAWNYLIEVVLDEFPIVKDRTGITT
ncbi:hypothetical protein GJ496_007681, partial [Pomphorhynchus laevis]